VKLPTASKVGLALACSFSWSPRAPRAPREAMSAAADKGNAVHEVCERLVRGQAVAWDRLPAEIAALARGAERFLADHPLELPRAEVPLAYDVATGVGREMPAGGHRAYADAKSTEIVGTADVFAVGVVLDWKTGRGARETSAADGWQLRVLALAAARAYGWRQVQVGYVHLEPGDYQADIATLGAWELDETADELSRIHEEIRAGEQQPQPGPHCGDSWCPIRSVCPTTAAALAKIDASVAAFVPSSFEVANDDDAKRARVCLKLVDEARNQLESNLKSYVRRVGHIDLGNGRAYGVREQARDTVSLTRDAAEVLIEAGAAEALEMSTSKAAIQRALATTRTGRGEAKRATDKVVATLREMGCVRTTTFERLEEFDNTKKESA